MGSRTHPGRPRKVSVEDTLEGALQLFWERGYEGTSIADLSRALGVSASSLYATFESKDRLYLRCMRHYGETRSEFVQEALAEENGIHALQALLIGAALAYGESGAGCAILAAQPGAAVDTELSEMRRKARERITRRIRRAQREGDVTRDLRASDLSAYVQTVMGGLSGASRDGASAAQLHRVAELANATIESWRA
ncbi:MAG: helix-turn-helix domain-containing protein [Myxococcota bacterium]